MSQNEAILRHLQSGRSITPLEALRLYGSMRLGARIYDLKRQGYNIQEKDIPDNGKRYASYFLPKEEFKVEANGQRSFV
uniref:Putative DNA binding, helix-turn-helix domain containing protein n=1 Tax=viral metagenome TaxID=1070528 RepID=A0A6M3J0Q0_9ZZZZ